MLLDGEWSRRQSAINKVLPHDGNSTTQTNNARDEEMIDDDISVITPKNHPPVSERVQDELQGCIEFAQRFRARYGPNSPNFFEGTLEDAFEESCLTPAKERKLLAVYLHHEHSVLSNVFCAQLLGCETALQTLAANFIVYGWDVTHPDNMDLLLTSVTDALDQVVSTTIQRIPNDQLPALIIIMRMRSNTEIYSVINGDVGVSELVGGLLEAVERFTVQREEDAKFEEERLARERVMSEQDEAYQMSLDADRAKEERKKQLELERNQEIERAEYERQMQEAHEESQRLGAVERVPPEPGADADDVMRIRVRLPPPHHKCFERRFRAQDTLAALLDFLASKGYPQENYKVISRWPRRDLTAESQSSTLIALELYPQETIILEER
ncbi:unnamed protein product [Pieris macdunnoughi]|uniref:UBX domain-containing protein n=1 Tax=Pieris macdunnoughi TaxID=345717 RepID=A0A821VVG3_9NEOP|nr:unnamed protein product [Pieris macdunnoughi]